MHRRSDECLKQAAQEGDTTVDYPTDDQGSDYGSDYGADGTGDYSEDRFGDTLADADGGGSDDSDYSDDSWGDDSDDGSGTAAEDYGTDYDTDAGALDSQGDMALNGSGPVMPKDSNRQKQIDQQLDPFLKPQVDAWNHSGHSEPIHWPAPDPEHDPIFGPHAGMDQ
jgi:hypothetical protein